MKYLWLIILILILPLAIAMPVEDVHLSTTVNKYVYDYTETLNSGEIQSLNLIADSFRVNGTAEIAIVLVDNFNDLSIEEYSMTIAHENIGDTDKDNGILILVGIDVREYRVEIGYGLEGILNDAKVGRLARENIVPYFQAERYGEGIVALLYSFHNEMLPNQEVVGFTPRQYKNDYSSLIFYGLFFVIFVVSRTMSELAYAKKNGQKARPVKEAFTAALIASLFFRGGGRGGMGGGGGFGGGGFGGGGFSGGW